MTEKQKEMKESVLRISGASASKCMKCGKCSGACPAYNMMEYHPHQFVSLVERGRIEELMNSKSLWNCFSCFACVERCPRDVQPAMIIEAVRLTVIRGNGQNHLEPDEIPSLLDGEMPCQTLVSAFRKYSK